MSCGASDPVHHALAPPLQICKAIQLTVSGDYAVGIINENNYVLIFLKFFLSKSNSFNISISTKHSNLLASGNGIAVADMTRPDFVPSILIGNLYWGL